MTGDSIPSFAKMLFFGEVEENQLFPYPLFSDKQKELAVEIINSVQSLAKDSFDSEKFDQTEEIPAEVLEQLSQMGLCGLTVPEEFGGMELDPSLNARVFSEISGSDGSIATTLGAHQSIGYKALINEGTKEQKEKWLPQLASGEKWAAFCLTEPGSGSDAYSIKTKAVDNGDKTYSISGQKLWITNAGIADFFTVFCKTDHEEKDGTKKQKISCFIVEKGMKGVSVGEKEKKMGIRGSDTRAVFFDNVVVPAENMIGQPGKGFKIAMNVLNSGRLSLGSGAVGGMKTLIKLATAHTLERKQFNQHLIDMGMIQEKLVEMLALTYATESMVYLTTGLINEGMSDYSVESAMCKVFGSEALWEVSDISLQIAAGIGYMREYPYERIMRDSRINLIFEGTNEILRIFIALSGIKGPSDILKELGKIADVSKVLNDPIKSLGVLTDFARDFALKRVQKMIGSKYLSKVDPELKPLGDDLSLMVREFSIKVENTLIKLGKKIIGNELTQKRIADMAISLFCMSAVLSRSSGIIADKSIDSETKEQIKALTEFIFNRQKNIFSESRNQMDQNQDKNIAKIIGFLKKKPSYNFDIID
ncbi:MAG: acyl-CoA dehydrogenase family protein [Oligoflexales bacterium]|nr:acyl-CoA dehydrogenase family protein [Oligoflexales bacterium]